MKTNPLILSSAAHFNATHDYSIDAILQFLDAALRHAHLVQMSRVKERDPQLELPIDGL